VSQLSAGQAPTPHSALLPNQHSRSYVWFHAAFSLTDQYKVLPKDNHNQGPLIAQCATHCLPTNAAQPRGVHLLHVAKLLLLLLLLLLQGDHQAASRCPAGPQGGQG
jgi:hypothetical protein